MGQMKGDTSSRQKSSFHLKTNFDVWPQCQRKGFLCEKKKRFCWKSLGKPRGYYRDFYRELTPPPSPEQQRNLEQVCAEVWVGRAVFMGSETCVCSNHHGSCLRVPLHLFLRVPSGLLGWAHLVRLTCTRVS